MNERLTRGAAIEQVVHYLERSLDGLPGVTLTQEAGPGRPGVKGFDMNGCTSNDSYDPKTTPSQLQADYWLVGVPASREKEYLQTITAAWQAQGFKIGSGANESLAPFGNAEGYRLALNAPKGQPDSISVSVQTPCIKPENFVHDKTELPVVIKPSRQQS